MKEKINEILNVITDLRTIRTEKIINNLKNKVENLYLKDMNKRKHGQYSSINLK